MLNSSIEEGDWCYMDGESMPRRRITQTDSNVALDSQEIRQHDPLEQSESNQRSITKGSIGFLLLKCGALVLALLSLARLQTQTQRKLNLSEESSNANHHIVSFARRTPSHRAPCASLLGRIHTESQLATHDTALRKRQVGPEAAAAAQARRNHYRLLATSPLVQQHAQALHASAGTD